LCSETRKTRSGRRLRTFRTSEHVDADVARAAEQERRLLGGRHVIHDAFLGFVTRRLFFFVARQLKRAARPVRERHEGHARERRRRLGVVVHDVRQAISQQGQDARPRAGEGSPG
jgi:hypothetical protein